MELSDIYLAQGEPAFHGLIRGISIGKLKTFQLYERVKLRFHLTKLNSETLRKAAPRFWTRIQERDNEFASDLAQVILVSHLDMIREVLDFLGIPNEDGFFAKDLDASGILTDGWQERAFENFRTKYPEPVLVFYLNHLGWELLKQEQPFRPASAVAS
jgi:hypothetical protein